MRTEVTFANHLETRS